MQKPVSLSAIRLVDALFSLVAERTVRRGPIPLQTALSRLSGSGYKTSSVLLTGPGRTLALACRSAGPYTGIRRDARGRCGEELRFLEVRVQREGVLLEVDGLLRGAGSRGRRAPSRRWFSTFGVAPPTKPCEGASKSATIKSSMPHICAAGPVCPLKTVSEKNPKTSAHILVIKCLPSRPALLPRPSGYRLSPERNIRPTFS